MYSEDFYAEKELRKNKIIESMQTNGIDAVLLCDNANLFYTSGRVFSGYTYITTEGVELYFVKRPIGLSGDDVIYIRKPENIPDALTSKGLSLPDKIGFELDSLSYSDTTRLKKLFLDSEIVNASSVMRAARSIKTKYEINQLFTSGLHHSAVYGRIHKIYQNGMTDIELQIEIERLLRLEGCLGQFRISGPSMEIFMGNLLCGDNADSPSPYDFAMGGAGLHSSIPVGSNGSQIKPGMSVMVDMCGNFTGYMTDMTRTFYVGNISDLALKAHQTSIKICNELAILGRPGEKASTLYEKAIEIAIDAGLEDYFMGHRQKAGFVGHGVGIEVNEMPVLAPRSKDILSAGNVIAIEPKFVIPHIGAVGIENTYVVEQSGMAKLTNFPEEITQLY